MAAGRALDRPGRPSGDAMRDEQCSVAADCASLGGALLLCLVHVLHVESRSYRAMTVHVSSSVEIDASEEAGLSRHVRKMRDVFRLERSTASAGRTILTRSTDLDAAGPCPWLRGVALSVAIRRIHRFTLRGFKTIAEAS
jgi:hypothetical protein